MTSITAITTTNAASTDALWVVIQGKGTKSRSVTRLDIDSFADDCSHPTIVQARAVIGINSVILNKVEALALASTESQAVAVTIYQDNPVQGSKSLSFCRVVLQPTLQYGSLDTYTVQSPIYRAVHYAVSNRRKAPKAKSKPTVTIIN